MRTFRTKETHERYEKQKVEGLLEKGCNLCNAPSVKDFQYWRIVKNAFPYDRIAEVHDMIILRRHAKAEEVSEDEKKEYEYLKVGYINETYEMITEPTLKMKTIPLHVHLHLIVIKNFED